MNDLISCIKAHEGLSLYVYKDSLGHDTIGYGRCIDRSHGISEAEAEFLLKNDIEECKKQLEDIEWYIKLDKVRQEVMIELCFNMGIMSLLQFRTMINYIKEENYSYAASDLLDTLWAHEVGKNRANNMAARLSTGSYSA